MSPAPRFLLRLAALAVLSSVVSCGSSIGSAPKSSQATGKYSLTPQDDAFLDDLSRRVFNYFKEQASSVTGLVRDRARSDGTQAEQSAPASIAATGFGLTALSIAPDRGWISRNEARARVRRVLRFFAGKAPQVHGWFYHFVDPDTGERRWNCEVSSIDSALLLAGILTARARFQEDEEIRRLASEIYERVDFQWMLNGDRHLLSHGWKPETGFLKYRWDTYSEDTLLYLLAIGSPHHAIPPEAWYAWKRQYVAYGGYTYLSSAAPLFVHQYSHAWVDYRDRRESRAPHTDYFANSVAATRAHRLFCADLAREFPGYSQNVWGITSSDSVKGYVAWGGPPRSPLIDGTVVPAAAGGSLMFTPDICLPALRTMREKFGGKIWGRYGFVDAFNPNTWWVDTDVIGTDLGITLLSAENLRSGAVWRWFMNNPEISRALSLAGLEQRQPQ